MGRTLNLLDTLLLKAQALHELGRSRDALPILRRLNGHPELPQSERLRIHELLGYVYLSLHEFRRARRHFSAAIKLQPDDASTHHGLALAIQNDPEVDARRASRHYRKALELASADPQLLVDAGAYAVQMGHDRKGLSLIRKAAALAPNNLTILRALIEALCDTDRHVEARRELSLARFRLNGTSGFQRLFADFEFQDARRRQRQASHLYPASASPEVLPFLRVRGADGKRVRARRILHHNAAALQRPHFPRVTRRSDSSHAP